MIPHEPPPPGRRPGASGTAAAATLLLVLAAFPGQAGAWGSVGHEIITGEAAARVPPEIAGFFQGASARISSLSLEPDRLKKKDPAERPRHYINLDSLDDPPFGEIPVERGEAVALFGEKALERQGSLPWHAAAVFEELKEAMAAGRREEILRSAGHLAHYVGDLFQPLHVVTNYDGRETCNQGVHGAFESEMIERRPEHYRDGVARGERSVARITTPASAILAWARASWPLAEAVLEADTAAVKALKSRRTDYYDSMDRMAGPIAQRQMSAAANALASLWYTAWEEAGRPSLP